LGYVKARKYRVASAGRQAPFYLEGKAYERKHESSAAAHRHFFGTPANDAGAAGGRDTAGGDRTEERR